MGYVSLTRNSLVEQTLDPVTLSGDGGTSKATHVDGLGWASVMYQVLIGESADTLSGDLYWSLILQDSDTETDGDFADVTSNDLIEGTFVDAANGVFAKVDVAAEDDAAYEVEYKQAHPNAKRYTRVILTRTGNHANGTPIGCLGIKHYPESDQADGF